MWVIWRQAGRAFHRVLSAPISVISPSSAPSRTAHRHTMSPTCDNSYSAIVFCCLVGFNLIGMILSSSVDSRDLDYQQRPVLLPLYISPTNSTHRRVFDRDHRLRHLQNLVKPHSSNARMRLHDDLLTNGSVFQKFSTIRFCFRISFICLLRIGGFGHLYS